jgi:hypothetical protein
MRWHSYRPRVLTTQVGEVRVARAYWHCPACGAGQAPADAVWGLPPGQASWGVRQSASILGALVPSFAKAAEVLAQLTPMRVSARALDGWTEEVGAAYELPVPEPTDPGPVADVLFVEVDGGQALFTDRWHEVKVAAVWRRVAGVDQPVQYAAVQGPWAAHEEVLTGLARRGGSRLAGTLVCLADGERGQWRVLERLFPAAVFLLDWYHLLTHLGTLATTLHLDASWLETQQTALLHQGPQETLRALVALARQSGWSAEQAECLRACLGYVWHNRHRMDYAGARQAGYPIGSGRIESAIKQVLQARAKGPGMRWTHDHLQAVLNARCAWLNGDWELASAQTRAQARSLPPGARPLHPPFRLRVPAIGAARVATPERQTRITLPDGTGLSGQQMARVFREALGSQK